KALGTGLWAEGVEWKDFEVVRASTGQPVLHLHGGAQRHAQTMGVTKMLISLTHTKELAQAQVILA
ncbi:MAG TPA: hypothetical protein VGE29_11840, partial [Prosthecobacter sp.]